MNLRLRSLLAVFLLVLFCFHCLVLADQSSAKEEDSNSADFDDADEFESSTPSSPDDDAALESSKSLQSLLQWSARSPLIRVNAADFDLWVEAKDRPYSLVVFMTASQQCTQCVKIEQSVAAVAKAYEYARYPRSPSATSSQAATSHLPNHHIFFLTFDAHLDEGVGRGGMRNLAWFQKQGISKVPELMLIDFTVPDGLVRGLGIDPPKKLQGGNGSEIDGVEEVFSAQGRRAQRLKAMRERRNKRYERIENESKQVNGTESVSNQTEAATLTSKAPPLPNSAAAIAEAERKKREKEAAEGVKPTNVWRDMNQTHIYPVSTSLTAQHVVNFVVEHTEKFNLAPRSLNRSTNSEPLSVPLHRSVVVRADGLRLNARSDAAANLQPASDSIVPSFITGLQPFFSSIFLFTCTLFLWYIGTVSRAVPFIVFYLWNIVGSMNNIQKDMPVIGMGRDGAMFFYPGHGSFVGESILMALLYGYCAATVLGLINVNAIYEAISRKSGRSNPSIRSAAGARRENTTLQSAGGPPSSSDVPPSGLSMKELDQWMEYKRQSGGVRPDGAVQTEAVPGETPSTSSATTNSKVSNASSGNASAAVRAGMRPAHFESEIEPFEISPRWWVLFFVFTFHFAFSLIRTIYTKKNGRYKFGYLI